MSDDDRPETFPASRRRFLQLSAGALAALGTVMPAADAVAADQGPLPIFHGEADLPGLTIAGAGRLLRGGHVSPVDLTRASLERIDRLDPKVGAFITVSRDHAMESARQAERDIRAGRYRGPLHGIPVGVKDTHYTAGIRTTAGSPVLADFVPDRNAAIVERLEAAGAILVGKLKLPEFSFGGTTPGCNNPWDLTRNAGGSSGGPAAALAASMVLGASGGDTSGSIRNPASTCGVVGLKPTFGLVSRYAVVPISWTLDHLGPMAKTVEDTTLLLQVMAGYDARDRYSVNTPVPDYRRLLDRPMRGVKLGVLASSEISGFHPDVLRAFADAVKVFEGLGASLREVTFPARMKVAGHTQEIIRIAEAAAYHRQFLTTAARDRYVSDVGQATTGVGQVRTTVEAGSLITAAQYVQAQRVRSVFIADKLKTYEPIDALLSPTMPAPAGVRVSPGETYRSWWNLSGFPAVSLPCGFSTDPPGLPLGLQVSAKPFDDALVLAVARAYEVATRWHEKRAAI